MGRAVKQTEIINDAAWHRQRRVYENILMMECAKRVRVQGVPRGFTRHDFSRDNKDHRVLFFFLHVTHGVEECKFYSLFS